MQSAVINYHLKEKDLYILPKDEKHTETFIFLHGLGDYANGEWFNRLFSKSISPCFPSTKVILLQAPTAKVSIKGGHVPSWYDIKLSGLNIEDSFSMIEAETNKQRIHKVLEEEIKLLKGDSKKVILAGFSQGCAMALHAGLEFDKPLGGIIGWSGFMFPTTKVNKANDKTPLLIANGVNDGTVPFFLADMSFMRLKVMNNPVTRINEKGLGHIINENIVKETAKFLTKILKK